MTITKDKIANMLKSRLGLSGVICEEIVNEVFNNIQEIVMHQKLTLKNFGSFYMTTKQARPGRNFHTQERIMIPSRHTIHFIPASKLKRLINSHAR